MTADITRERAERIARAQACPRCKEYTYKKLKLRAAVTGDQIAGAAWIADMVCGVCGAHLQLALESDGDVLFFN
jgi:transcription elongation factor Elf1